MRNTIKSHYYIGIILLLIVSFVIVNKSYATSIPTFPSCLNPQGTIKVNYNNGNHGVPGDTSSYSGIDTVYYLTEDTLTQCLCPENGNAIQTNWWKIDQLSEKEIKEFTGQGWIYVPDGSAWGLDESTYLAQNIKYSCVGGKGGSSNGNSSTHNSSSSNTSSGSQSSGQANGASTGGNILGLASTGNIMSIYIFIIFGISLLLSGIYIQRAYPKHNE